MQVDPSALRTALHEAHAGSVLFQIVRLPRTPERFDCAPSLKPDALLLELFLLLFQPFIFLHILCFFFRVYPFMPWLISTGDLSCGFPVSSDREQGGDAPQVSGCLFLGNLL